MCGHFGMMGAGIQFIDTKILKELSFAAMLRGRDGTGIAYGKSHEKGNKPTILKDNGDALYFDWGIKDDERKKLNNVNNNYFIGHTRWLTTGKPTYEATHPFEHSKLVGAHNGTLFYDYEGYANDSDKLFGRINDVGIQAAINELDKDDAYALVWYDKETKKVNFLRNEKRELYFALHPDRSVLYWFSEAAGLRWILARNGVVPKVVWEATENVKFTFDPGCVTIYNKGQRELLCTTSKIAPPIIDRKPPPKVISIGKKATATTIAPWADWQGEMDSYEQSERERMQAAMGV